MEEKMEEKEEVEKVEEVEEEETGKRRREEELPLWSEALTSLTLPSKKVCLY